MTYLILKIDCAQFLVLLQVLSKYDFYILAYDKISLIVYFFQDITLFKIKFIFHKFLIRSETCFLLTIKFEVRIFNLQEHAKLCFYITVNSDILLQT